MSKQLKGIVGSLLEMERLADVAKGAAEGYPQCTECGWSSDDPELDICCDCVNEIFFKQMLRGDFGKAEQREARQSRDHSESIFR
jgi:hypothetical protein